MPSKTFAGRRRLTPPIWKGDLLMSLARLSSLATVDRAYRGDAEGAMQELLAHALFARKLIETPQSLVGFAIALSVGNAALSPLPYILSKDKSLVVKYRKELEAALVFAEPGRFDYTPIWDTEIRTVRYLMERQRRHFIGGSTNELGRFITETMFGPGLNRVFREKMFELHEKMKPAFVIKDPATRRAALQAVNKEFDRPEYWYFTRYADITHLYPSMMMGLLAGGMTSGTIIMFDDSGMYVNKHRERLALIDAAGQGLWPDAMPDYLKSAAARNPLLGEVMSGQPFYWNNDTKSICYDLVEPYFTGPFPVCFDTFPYVGDAGELK